MGTDFIHAITIAGTPVSWDCLSDSKATSGDIDKYVINTLWEPKINMELKHDITMYLFNEINYLLQKDLFS